MATFAQGKVVYSIKSCELLNDKVLIFYRWLPDLPKMSTRRKCIKAEYADWY